MMLSNSQCTAGTTTTFATITSSDIYNLYTDFEAEIESNTDPAPNKFPLIGSSVRLMFHDCGGPSSNSSQVSICDGCLDFVSNPSHAGIHTLAIEPLEILYLADGYWCSKMNRADFWATCAIIALNFAQEIDDAVLSTDHLPYIKYYFGRESCSTSPSVNTTTYTSGMKEFPNPMKGLDHVFDWFSTNFDLSLRETVALIGAHTLGRTHSFASGLVASTNTGPWMFRGEFLNNHYYVSILQSSVNWVQVIAVNNTNKMIWSSQSPSMGASNFFIMLNADMGLIFRLEDSFVNDSTGEVSCNFTSCVRQNKTFDIVVEFANSNQLWLNEFAAVFEKMITTGYDTSVDLYEVPC